MIKNSISAVGMWAIPRSVRTAVFGAFRVTLFVLFCGCVLGFAGVLSGCISGHEIVAADVSPEGWTDPALIEYDNRDTLNIKWLSLSLRHSAEVVPAVGEFVVGTTSPAGIQTRDTLRMALLVPPADAGNFGRPGAENSAQMAISVAENSAPIGETNNLRETAASFGRPVVLGEPGRWIFSVTPLSETRGVWSIALVVN